MRSFHPLWTAARYQALQGLSVYVRIGTFVRTDEIGSCASRHRPLGGNPRQRPGGKSCRCRPGPWPEPGRSRPGPVIARKVPDNLVVNGAVGTVADVSGTSEDDAWDSWF